MAPMDKSTSYVSSAHAAHCKRCWPDGTDSDPDLSLDQALGDAPHNEVAARTLVQKPSFFVAALTR